MTNVQQNERDTILAELATANQALENDPSFQADVAGGEFVARVLTAMDSLGISQSKLADAIGTSRQYINRILNEENQGNYTLDTLFGVSYAVGLRPKIEYAETTECIGITFTTQYIELEDSPAPRPPTLRPLPSLKDYINSNFEGELKSPQESDQRVAA